MSKKGLISSLIIGLVATLSLGIYTIVSVVVGNKVPDPTNITISMAYRTGDAVSVLDGYSTADGNLTVTLDADTAESPLVYDQLTGKYTAGDVNGGLTAVVKNSKRKTTTYIIKVYKQGEGTSADDAYIIASAEHLKEFADIANALNQDTPAYTKLVADVDISAYNWKPIGGHEDTGYSGTFDGNGHTVKGLTIDVDMENYEEFLTVVTKDGSKNAYLDLGFFGNTSFATIKNLSIANAKISVGAEVYEQFASADAPETDVYDVVKRVSIGALVGNAYNTTISGAIETAEDGTVTKKASVVSRINGFSYTGGARHGIGGLVGAGNLVRVSDYAVNVNVINNHVGLEGSYIGGVVGYADSTKGTIYGEHEVTVTDMTVISGVEVDFTATALYSNKSFVGGVAGATYNSAIVDSKVKSFKVVDTSARSSIDYTLETPTVVGGITAHIEIKSAGYTNGFISRIENVDVAGIDVYMLGGDIAGAVVNAGKEQTGTAQTGLTIKDVTVSGVISGNTVAGFVHQNNAGSAISYTKAFDAPVVDIVIKANMSAGFVFDNAGVITGFVDVETSDMTSVKVEIKATGALILNANDRANVVNARKSTYAAGFVAKTDKVSNIIPTISNFDVVASIKDSINMSGFAYKVGTAVISNVDVNATITSYNYTKEEKNFSTTYMVAGAVCEASAGAVLENINVIVNANKDVDTTKMYGATFFGGLIARYTGDVSSIGLTVNNCVVSGEVYFNYTDERVIFETEELGVFSAGGLIGSISTPVGGAENVDAFLNVSIAKTTITNSTVNDLKITAGFKTESVDSTDAWRVRAIGAIIGVLNSNSAETLNLSSCKATDVEIVADEDTFTFVRTQQGGQLIRLTLGAGKTASYGSSYAWFINGSTTATVEPTEVIDVTYTQLA
ncbi:MAG: hypothetical protein IKC11_06265 [Clostridia bacterium]|nr:hypothetical protein [Clostridia bacterium]